MIAVNIYIPSIWFKLSKLTASSVIGTLYIFIAKLRNYESARGDKSIRITAAQQFNCPGGFSWKINGQCSRDAMGCRTHSTITIKIDGYLDLELIIRIYIRDLLRQQIKQKKKEKKGDFHLLCTEKMTLAPTLGLIWIHSG